MIRIWKIGTNKTRMILTAVITDILASTIRLPSLGNFLNGFVANVMK